jgi:hypothetical protein
MKHVASSSSNLPSEPPEFSYFDHFIGRPIGISFKQRAQISRSLELIKAAVQTQKTIRLISSRRREEEEEEEEDTSRIVVQRSACNPHHQLLPPLNYMHFNFWPAQVVRVMFGCVSTIVHGLATPPANFNVDARNIRHWATCITVRIMQGCISKIQVLLCCICVYFLCKCFLIIDTHCSKHWLMFRSVAPHL